MMKYVEGYYRGREETLESQPTKTTDESGFIVGATLFGVTSVSLAFIFLKLTLAILAVAGIAYYVKGYTKLRQERAVTPSLIVNTMGKSSKIYI